MRPNWIHWSMFEWIDAKHRRHFFLLLLWQSTWRTLSFFNVAATHSKIVCWWMYFPGTRKLREFEWLEKVLSGTPMVLPVMTTGGHAILNRFRLFGANPLPDLFMIYNKQGLIIQSISKTKSLVVKRFPLKKLLENFICGTFCAILKMWGRHNWTCINYSHFIWVPLGFKSLATPLLI